MRMAEIACGREHSDRLRCKVTSYHSLWLLVRLAHRVSFRFSRATTCLTSSEHQSSRKCPGRCFSSRPATKPASACGQPCPTPQPMPSPALIAAIRRSSRSALLRHRSTAYGAIQDHTSFIVGGFVLALSAQPSANIRLISGHYSFSWAKSKSPKVSLFITTNCSFMPATMPVSIWKFESRSSLKLRWAA